MVGSVNVVASESHDVLNYFGKCPVCDYPTRAVHITAKFDDGRVESQTIASCGGWCGWKGPVEPTPMTGAAAVMAPSRGTVPSPDRRASGYSPSELELSPQRIRAALAVEMPRDAAR